MFNKGHPTCMHNRRPTISHDNFITTAPPVLESANSELESAASSANPPIIGVWVRANLLSADSNSWPTPVDSEC